MINWYSIGIEMLRISISVVIATIFSLYILGQTLKKQGPEIAKEVLKMDYQQVESLKGPRGRVEKTANAKIAEDLMTNTPLSSMMNILSEETREYIKEHPEVLPNVLQSYAGILDLVLKLSPPLASIMGISLQKDQAPKYDL